jgi:HSP20 family molecular chaperone IbpA
MPAIILPTTSFFEPSLSHCLARQFDQLYDSTTEHRRCANRTPSSLLVNETESSYDFSFDVPGVKASDLKVTIEDRGRILHVSGERKIITNNRNKSYKSTYDRRVSIPKDIVDFANASATVNDGVLSISLPKTADIVDDNDKKTQEVTTVMVSTEDPELHENMYNLSVDVPGVKAADIKLEVTNVNEKIMLTLTSTRKGRNGAKDTILKRFWSFGDDVDTSGFKAYLVDGVLTVVASKLEDEIIEVPIKTDIMVED